MSTHFFICSGRLALQFVLPIYMIHYFLRLRRYFSPHAAISFNTGCKDMPVLVSVYSTLGGTSANTLRESSLLSSNSFKLLVSTFWEHPTLFFNSPKRLVPVNKSRIIRIFHLLPINLSSTATGHGGKFFFVIILFIILY